MPGLLKPLQAPPGCTLAYFSFAFTPTFNSGAITRPAVESTEDMLRGMYDKEGIEYDDRMIRDDSRAVEQLHREFGQ